MSALATLAPTSACAPACPPAVVANPCNPCGYGMSGWGQALLWFIVIAVIVWFILYAWKPVWVLKTLPNGQVVQEVDPLRVLIGSVLIALIIILIIWIFRTAGRQ